MGTTTEQLITQATQYPDYIVIGVVFAVFTLYGFVRGAKAISELALSLPVAAFVYMLIPYDLAWGAPAVYGALSAMALWVLARDTSGLDDTNALPKVLLAAVGATGLLLVVSVSVVDFTSLYTFGAPIAGILAEGTYRFYLVAASLVAVALSRKV